MNIMNITENHMSVPLTQLIAVHSASVRKCGAIALLCVDRAAPDFVGHLQIRMQGDLAMLQAL